MIQSVRLIKNRLCSVDNTRKITRAMEMVSSVKLNRVRDALFNAKNYFFKIDEILKNILLVNKNKQHPLLKERKNVENILVCVITSDTGLCANFNNQIIKTAENFLKNYPKDKVALVCVGKKAFVYFKKKEFNILHSVIGLYGRYNEKITKKISDILFDALLSDKAREAYVIYSYFVSKVKNIQVVEKIIDLESNSTSKRKYQEYIIEPNIIRVLDELLARYAFARMRAVILNSFASEHSARMITMKTANDNAAELIENLILLRNKTRQSAITKEVLEIASAAEALKI